MKEDSSKAGAYRTVKPAVKEYRHAQRTGTEESRKCNRLPEGDTGEAEEEDIYGSGYVLHSLEASLWCLLTTGSYKEAMPARKEAVEALSNRFSKSTNTAGHES